MITLLMITAIVTGSLTMLSEAVRGLLLVVIQFYSVWMMYAAHRGRLDHYEYGVGKLEQFVWVVVGISLILGALWVAQAIIDTLLSSEPAISPLGLAMAAIVNGINMLLNGLALYAMYSATRDRESGVFGAQIRARIGMLLVTSVLQISLTVAALARDAGIALTLDALGASMIVCIKLQIGISMLARGIPDLLDAPATKDLAARIRRAVYRFVPDRHVISIRTRRSGETTFAEVAVSRQAFPSIAELRACAVAINEALHRDGAVVDLSLNVAPGSPDSTS
jgi:divalent metal cation (Fe/Co/Zn/Cd) transporter